METKACNECKVEKPFTSEYFSINKRIKSGLDGRCKNCKYKTTKKWLKNPLNRKPGVYGMFENGICLYVGESKDIPRRLSQHKSWIKNPKLTLKQNNYRYKFYESLSKHNIIFKILEKTDNHVEREQYYINKFKPIYNA